MLRAAAKFLLSLKAASGVFFAFIVLCFAGSVVIPANLAFFSGIDDTPLFRWLSSNADFGLTWWIYAMIAAVALLALSTVFCTVDSLMKGAGRQNLALKLSPQIMHMGVLFIMLGHLLTASYGFKSDVLLKKGEPLRIAGGPLVRLDSVRVRTDKNGYASDWEAALVLEGSKDAGGVVLKPAHPAYSGGFGLYLKSVSGEPDISALVGVRRDPGAIWALIGGVFLSAGGLAFIYGRGQ